MACFSLHHCLLADELIMIPSIFLTKCSVWFHPHLTKQHHCNGKLKHEQKHTKTGIYVGKDVLNPNRIYQLVLTTMKLNMQHLMKEQLEAKLVDQSWKLVSGSPRPEKLISFCSIYKRLIIDNFVVILDIFLILLISE